jgi:hypothetical protein
MPKSWIGHKMKPILQLHGNSLNWLSHWSHTDIASNIWSFFCHSLDSGLKVLQEMAHQDHTLGHNMSRTEVGAYITSFRLPYIC